MQVTCDDCGSVQDSANGTCELCNASLSEEEARGKRVSGIALLGGALLATGVFCIAPGLAIKAVKFEAWSAPAFWGPYFAVWVLGAVLSQHYQPKESYEFYGWGGYFDNPFSLQDDIDRHHATIGLILFPVGIITGLWIGAFRAFTGR